MIGSLEACDSSLWERNRALLFGGLRRFPVVKVVTVVSSRPAAVR